MLVCPLPQYVLPKIIIHNMDIYIYLEQYLILPESFITHSMHLYHMAIWYLILPEVKKIGNFFLG